MNEFEYIILSKKIDAFTTIKQHEQCARELYKKLKDMGSSWGNRISVNFDKYDISIYENIYKALRKVVNNYTGASSLPLFITDALAEVHRKLAREYIKSNPPYERFIDVFQFDTTVKFRYLDSSGLKSLALLVGDNKPPFEIDFYFSTSDIYSNAAGGINIKSELNTCLEIEELKRTLPKNITYTVIEDALDRYYKNIILTSDRSGSHNTTKDTMPDFVQKMKNLVTVAQTACDRINRENFG